MTSAVEQRIRAALACVMPDLASVAPLEFRPLRGGLSERSFLVAAGERELVVRLAAAGAPPLLDVGTEAEVMRAAAAAGLAPAVVGVDREQGALVTEYRAAAAWSAAAACEPRNIARIAAALRRLHALPAAAPPFAAVAIAHRYVTDTIDLARSTADADPTWGAELMLRARAFEARSSADALCHNDLLAANILDDGTLLLVDFEYAVRAAPLLDLASFAAMNDLPHEQRGSLLAEYYRRPVSPDAADALDETVRMLRLMAYVWALLGRMRAPKSDVYAQLAERLARTLHREPI